MTKIGTALATRRLAEDIGLESLQFAIATGVPCPSTPEQLAELESMEKE